MVLFFFKFVDLESPTHLMNNFPFSYVMEKMSYLIGKSSRLNDIVISVGFNKRIIDMPQYI